VNFFSFAVVDFGNIVVVLILLVVDLAAVLNTVVPFDFGAKVVVVLLVVVVLQVVVILLVVVLLVVVLLVVVVVGVVVVVVVLAGAKVVVFLLFCLGLVVIVFLLFDCLMRGSLLFGFLFFSCRISDSDIHGSSSTLFPSPSYFASGQSSPQLKGRFMIGSIPDFLSSPSSPSQ